MKVKDQKKFDDWKANQKDDDPMAQAYGMACFTYAERWADMMEAELAEDPNKDFGEMAKRLSHEADSEGITGFMYGCAVSILSECWEHGDALRAWHNGQYGVKEEDAKGGVVNPAVLTIGKKEE